MEGSFIPIKKVRHTHQGSIGNLCNAEITEKMKNVIGNFNFDRVETALNKLLTDS